MTADGTLPALKVLQIGKYFYPDEGGIETVTLGISTALAADNIQADVLCFARRAAYDPIAAPPYDVVRARPDFVIGTRIFSSDYVAKVRDLAPRYDAALLHCPNPLAMAAALLFWRKPLILIWHADILPYPALAPLIRPLERASIRQAAAIVSPTSAHTDGSYLASQMVAKREIIPLPFDATRLPAASQNNAELRRVLAFLAGRQLVLAVGRLVPYKGFDVLIKAIATMDPRLAVVVVGTGPEATALAAASAAAGVDERILFIGRAGDAALAALYELAFAVTMPSVTRAEMYGMTQVEAMSYGRPVVSTRIPRSGVDRVNIDGVTGLTVAPGDPTALASALNRLVAEPELYARLAAGAKATCAADHGIVGVGRRYAALIRRVVAEAERQRAA